MFYLSVVSETLLYICFALLMATYFFALVPSDRKPKLVVSTNMLLLAVGGIVLFSFMPVAELISHLYQHYGVGQALQTILLTFTVGQGWLMTLVLSIILGLFITITEGKAHKGYSCTGIGLVFLLILVLGWSSHASFINPIAGFPIHSVHFLTVVIWIGLLFIASWFSKNTANWLGFLKWFHITALGCFAITIISGLLLMNLITDGSSYTDGWMVSYGQSLLIKHLLIIPLIGYALINGILMKRRLQSHSEFDPRPWTKVEFFVVLFIFAVTGAMNRQSPSSNLETIIGYEGLSPLFTLFYDGPIQPYLNVTFGVNGYTILFGLLAVIFFIISIGVFREKLSPIFSFIMAAFVVVSGYLALLMSVVVL